jgi:hypothetical protein
MDWFAGGSAALPAGSCLASQGRVFAAGQTGDTGSFVLSGRDSERPFSPVYRVGLLAARSLYCAFRNTVCTIWKECSRFQ